jgi:hypothetical protein
MIAEHQRAARTPPLPLGTPEAGAASPGGTAMAGLGRELEALRRDLDDVRQMAGRVDELTGCVDELAATVRQLAETLSVTKTQTPDAEGAPSWLDLPADPGRPGPTSPAVWDAAQLLATLAPWVGGVYLRYHDATSSFPDCWMWHAEVVEELLWLHQAWLAAYAPGASANAVGDWHNRQRPGVAARIRDYAGICSLEAHQPGQERSTPARVTPATDAVEAIAAWWATNRDQPGPTPTDEQLATAATQHRLVGRSRR